MFFLKVFENTLGTLRLIVVANGKKHTGAFLQFIISLIWIFSTTITINNITKDYFKIIAFALGCYVGSLIGSILEEKIALGSNLIIVITNINSSKCMIKKLRNNNFAVTSFKGQGKDEFRKILIIMVKRKLRQNIFSIVKSCDKNALIIVEIANASGGYY